MENTTWRKEIEFALSLNGEKWSDIVHITLNKEDLDINFNSGYGTTYGKPFAMWTTNYVYFPVQYDGSEWVESVKRNPDNKPINHIGGG